MIPNQPIRRGPVSGFIRSRQYYAGLVIGRLARCARAGLPLRQAILHLSEIPELRDSARPGATWWQIRMRRVAEDVDAGLRLSEALNRQVGRKLPAYVIDSLQHAENNDAVAETLDAISQGFDRSDATVDHIWSLRTPIMTLGIAVVILNGLAVFVLPRFARMYDEMIGVAPTHYDPIAQFCFSMAVFAPPALFAVQFALFCVAVFVVLWVFFRQQRWAYSAMEAICGFIPVVRGIVRRKALLESTIAVNAYVSCGEDIGTACDMAAYTTRSGRACKMLKMIAADVADGIPWADSWEAHAPRMPLYNWIARNAAAQGALTQGLRNMSIWLEAEIQTLSRLTIDLLAPLITMLNAVIVGSATMMIAVPLFRLSLFMCS